MAQINALFRYAIPLFLLPGVFVPAISTAAGPDWLINPAPYKARIDEDKTNRRLVLENGLARRVIQLAPNAATVELVNLTSGERLLRATTPEARITVDEKIFEIGGLAGQRVHNFLRPEEFKRLRDNPEAYHFAGLSEIGPIAPRFAWKKRPEWMPSDLPWPPPGKHVAMRYLPPGLPPRTLQGTVAFEETLGKKKEFDGGWKVHTSNRHPGTTFSNEGKPGEMLALPHTCAYAERAWPKDAASVEVTVFAGNDRESNSFGPGLALMTAAGPIVFSIRPDVGQLEIFAPQLGHLPGIGKYDRTKPCRLRVRLTAGSAVFEAAQENGEFSIIKSIGCDQTPTALRVGKLGTHGNGRDLDQPGKNLVQSAVQQVTVRGPEPSGAVVARSGLPEVEVHYEIYDGLPLISKWITVRNTGQTPVRLNAFTAEVLAVMEPESQVEKNPRWELPPLHVETDYTFGSMSAKGGNVAVKWKPDSNYGTQVNYRFQTPCLLECAPPQGPDQELKPGASLDSFRVFELLQDSTDRERMSLAQRRMYRTIAPWVTENPIIMHVRSADPAAVRQAVDQCADVGFEMVIMTFWSGFNFESRDPAYQATYKELAAYARSKGIALGGYSLLSSRSAATPADNTQGAPAQFGRAPCLGAAWGQQYLEQIKNFAANAGLGAFENDGSYPGDLCASTKHPGHRGLADSQWVQWKGITGLYQWCLANGVYLNVPDWYFLSGSNKIAMGYRESNWSLPRDVQEIVERQNVFDGTWEKIPSMGWMLVPLTEYQGGGAAATIEPLKEHLPHYERRLANLFGAGVQACYRGPRLYDAPETRAVVKKWVDFYKRHRAILDSDIIHLRRADGRDLDYILHVNPALKEKGLLMVYNPLPEKIDRTLTIPIYYTGISETARIREQEGGAKDYRVDRQFRVELPVSIPPHGFNWYVIE